MNVYTEADGVVRSYYPIAFYAITALSAIHIGGDPVSMVVIENYWSNTFFTNNSKR